MTYIPFGISDWSSAGAGVLDPPKWKIGGGDLYLTYRLYGKENGLAANTATTKVGTVGSGPTADTNVPAGISWATASKNLQYLTNLSTAAYALDPDDTSAPLVKNQRLKEIWVEAGTYKNSAGKGMVVNVVNGVNGVAIYGGFLPAVSEADDKDKRLAPLSTRPVVRESWFGAYGTLVAVESSRHTILDANGSDNVVNLGASAHNVVFDGFTVRNGSDSGVNIESNAYIKNLNAINNVTTWAGGGIYIAGLSAVHPLLENITVTGNKALAAGGGIYNDAHTVIVNALISGNTTDASKASASQSSGGGAVYIASQLGHLVIVNALISGNKTEITRRPDNNDRYFGGGGIKVDESKLTLINCTVSGNYASYNVPGGRTDLLPGGGIMVIRGGGVVEAYNSLVLGNSGESGLRNDVGTAENSTFTAYNSLVGGVSANILNTIGGSGILPGTGNADGTDYGTTATNQLGKLKQFFNAFDALPTSGNTGTAYVGDWTGTGWTSTDNFTYTVMGNGIYNTKWNFHLKSGATGAINGGSGAYLSDTYTQVPGGLQTDLDGATRVQQTAPDMGAYESPYQGMSVGGVGGP
jgi:hypothetical protein